jgi:hypothetical protein
MENFEPLYYEVLCLPLLKLKKFPKRTAKEMLKTAVVVEIDDAEVPEDILSAMLGRHPLLK